MKNYSTLILVPNPYVFEVASKRRNSSHCDSELTSHILDVTNAIHCQRQSNLYHIEQMFDGTIHWIVRCSKNADMTIRMDQLQHQNTAMGVQIVHGEGSKIIWSSMANLDQYAMDKP